jgi:hypothetical protein
MLMTCGVCNMCRFEEITTALNQEPSTTEDMDALERYLGAVEQVTSCLS